MTPSASTTVKGPVVRIPHQNTRTDCRLEPTCPPLFSLVNGEYSPAVDDTSDDAGDTPKTWAQYIRWAADRAGGVRQLADRAGLHRSTVYDWRNGKNSDTATVRSIRAIAEAVGDDPGRALRAAGQAVTGDDAPPPPPPAPTLADQLRLIRESGMPIDQQIAAAAELVALYRQLPEQAAEPRDSTRDSSAESRRSA